MSVKTKSNEELGAKVKALEEKMERLILVIVQMGQGKMNRLKEYLEGAA